MSLSYDWENNTKVTTPTGHVGRVRVTRRERQLIDDGKLLMVNVLGTDGLTRRYSIDSLTKIVEPEETKCDYRNCSMICEGCPNDY